MMRYKKTRVLLLVVIIVSLTSCNSMPSSVQSSGLSLRISLDKDVYCLADDIHVKAILTNNSDTSMLVDKTWSLLPGDWSPLFSTGSLVILDSSGSPLPLYEKRTVLSVNKDDFVVLPSADSIEKNIIVRDIHRAEAFSYGYQFQLGERYEISVIYQNVLDTTLEENGQNVNSWVGNMRAVDFFQISSENCSD